MRPTYRDIMAARYVLLGEHAETHTDVRNLPGADQCVHSLCGSGEAITEYEARFPLGTGTSRMWRTAPLRHHTYVRRPSTTTNPNRYDYCLCGNEMKRQPVEGNLTFEIHIECWR